MTRPLRIQYPGAFYHLTNRGNERKPIYKDEQDRLQFLKILSQSLENYQAVVHGFVLMSNHYHLLVETPLGNLSEFMRHFNITYTSYFNRRHRRVGHLFQGRYKSVLVEKDAYLAMVSMYIHLNPVKLRGFIGKPLPEQMEYLLDYRWSSLPGLKSLSKRFDFVEYGLVLGEYGGDKPTGRKAYMNHLEESLAKGLDMKENIAGQSVLGGAGFVSWVQEMFLEAPKDREIPSVGKLHSYIEQGRIIGLIAELARCSVDDLLHQKGEMRFITMDFLYRFGGLKNQEIGAMMGIDYSTVSQGRKRITAKRKESSAIDALMTRGEGCLSRIKI